MEDVSRRMVNDMATCIKANLETPAAPSRVAGGAPAAPPVQAAKQINAFSLLVDLIKIRLQRLFGRSS
jgi:hypothetical protein